MRILSDEKSTPNKFGAGLDVPPAFADVKLKSLGVTINTRGRYEFHVATEKASASIAVVKNTTGGYDKSFDAGLKIGSAEFEIKVVEQSGKKLLLGRWKETAGQSLDVASLFTHFGVTAKEFPSGLDIKLVAASIGWDKTDNVVVMDAKTSTGSAVFFVATKATGSWEAAGGVAIEMATAKSSLGEFGKLLDKVDLNLQDVCIIVSTIQETHFRMPPLPNFNLGEFPVLGTGCVPLQKGLVFAAEMDVKSSKGKGKDKRLSHLHTLAKKDTLVVPAEIADPLALSAIVISLGGGMDIFQKFELQGVQVVIRLEPLAVTVQGAAIVPVHGVKLTATGRLTLMETEAECAFDISASTTGGTPTSLPVPMGLKGVKLDEIGVEMGLIFEPPGINFGLEGKFQIGREAPCANNFAFAFAIVEPPPPEPIPLPDPLLLSVFIQTFSVETAIIAVSGKPDDSVPRFIRDFAITNLWLYYCEEPVTLPDGSMAMPGFGFGGFIMIHGWTAHAKLSVSSVSGIDGEAYMSPIRFGNVAQIGGKGTPPVVLEAQDINNTWIPVTQQAGGGKVGPNPKLVPGGK